MISDNKPKHQTIFMSLVTFSDYFSFGCVVLTNQLTCPNLWLCNQRNTHSPHHVLVFNKKLCRNHPSDVKSKKGTETKKPFWANKLYNICIACHRILKYNFHFFFWLQNTHVIKPINGLDRTYTCVSGQNYLQRK